MYNLTVTNYRKSTREGNLLGFLTIRFEDLGMDIDGFTVIQKDGKRWVNLPSREYTDRETGEKKYTRIINITKDEDYRAFCVAAKNAFDAYCVNAQAQPQQTTQTTDTYEDLPF